MFAAARRIAWLFAVSVVTVSSAEAAGCSASAGPSPALSMPRGAQALREGRAVRILAIGSSSTSGVGASAGGNYPSQLAGRLGEALGEGKVEITNAGVGGESAPSTLSRLKSFLAQPAGPDLVIWQVGTNDVIFGGNPASLNALVLDGLGAIQAAGAAALVVDQQYFPGIANVERYEEFVAAVDGAARARGVPLLKRYAMTKAWAAQDPQGFRATLSWDSFHSNDAGYSCLADLLAPPILSAVRGAGKPASPPAKPAATKPAAAPAKPAPDQPAR
ncbi:SGNH/GDSL hydrolase family protein [Xanthobacter autotrophicus DSM 431]|uniref:SGNH/GDSL hydrolase family protein n=1 Tax=Xanthobacter nonsaccharivorans TaxID=3119912 RepID=UPI00372776EC